MKSPIPASLSSLTALSTSIPLEILTSLPTPTLSPAPLQYLEPPDEFVQDYITYINHAIIAKKTACLGSSYV